MVVFVCVLVGLSALKCLRCFYPKRFDPSRRKRRLIFVRWFCVSSHPTCLARIGLAKCCVWAWRVGCFAGRRGLVCVHCISRPRGPGRRAGLLWSRSTWGLCIP